MKVHRPSLMCRFLPWAACFTFAILAWAQQGVFAQISFEKAPINYSTAAANDPFVRLQKKIDTGEIKLKFDSKHEYLAALLEALDVPVSSQMLVFSKTSFQLRKITPRWPRALYFSDDVYLGWVQNGDVIEIISVDPHLGPLFYTLDLQETDKPQFVRDKGQCIVCHASSRTEGVPGPLVRSVFSDHEGHPILGSGTFTIDHTSPLEQRWGGYYVSGTHGSQRHMGNQTADKRAKPVRFDKDKGANITDLTSLIDVEPYLTPHSDLVALMVLEHQSQMQNFITRANYETRSAKAYDEIMNDALSREEGHVSDSTVRRIHSAAENLVRYMLFADEINLTDSIKGVSTFAEDFSERALRDTQGRSLRDFDLQTRLFKYPCSYLIYSPSFDALPLPVRDRIYQRLWDILSSKEADADYAHLSAADRTAILEILRDTKPGLPEYWSPAG